MNPFIQLKQTTPLILIVILACFASPSTRAQNPSSEVEFQNPSLVGTWTSGNFAFTFFRNGTYVYVGAMGTPVEAKTSEKGTYTVNGDKLIIRMQSGMVTSGDYREDLKPETRVYRWRLGYEIGRTLQLIFPNGSAQTFYLSE